MSNAVSEVKSVSERNPSRGERAQQWTKERKRFGAYTDKVREKYNDLLRRISLCIVEVDTPLTLGDVAAARWVERWARASMIITNSQMNDLCYDTPYARWNSEIFRGAGGFLGGLGYSRLSKIRSFAYHGFTLKRKGLEHCSSGRSISQVFAIKNTNFDRG